MTMEYNSYNLTERPEEKYFSPGQEVTLKQNIPNKPIMIVKTIDRVAHDTEKPKLVGVTCMWFNTMMELQTARFSTKDLVNHDPNR